MSTTIKATCPTCGDVRLTVSDVKLAIAGPTDARDRSFYSFVCRGCSEEVIKPASEEVIEALSRVTGMTILHWKVPAEALDPIRWSHAALTMDDVLDLVLALQDHPSPAAAADLTPER